MRAHLCHCESRRHQHDALDGARVRSAASAGRSSAGIVDTEMVSPVLDSEFNPFEDEAQRYQVTPLGRPGRPEEIASAIFYLAVEGTYCNGAVLVVDGGSLA
jgi:NAD(P)-dependent dehydrogenase (short-subunit alcohol dehydrogenase family)